MSYTPPPNPSDLIKSQVRTAVPVALGTIATYLVALTAKQLGVTIDGQLAYAVLYVVTTTALYSAGRWLETRRWPPARFAGRLILSLGADLGKPTYQPTATAARPRPAANPDRRHNL